MITKNKPALKFRIKRSLINYKEKLKPVAALVLILTAYSLVGAFEYEDEVLQHQINCQSATYANDNGGCK